MEIDPVYLRAVFAGEFECLGRRLQSLRLAHLAALIAIDSPYLEGRPGTVADLAAAVGICTAPSVAPLLVRPWRYEITPQAAGRGVAAFSKRQLRRLAKKYANPFALMAEEITFMIYLADHNAAPEMWPENKEGPKGEPAKTPFLAAIKSALMRYCQCDHLAAWSYPLGEALWDIAAAGERESGESALMTTKDKKDVAEIEAWKASPEGKAAIAAAAERLATDKEGQE